MTLVIQIIQEKSILLKFLGEESSLKKLEIVDFIFQEKERYLKVFRRLNALNFQLNIK